jgi:hypothetical protein
MDDLKAEDEVALKNEVKKRRRTPGLRAADSNGNLSIVSKKLCPVAVDAGYFYCQYGKGRLHGDRINRAQREE